MTVETTLTTNFALDDEIPISQRRAMGNILQAAGISVAADVLMRGAYPVVLRGLDTRLKGRAFSATTVEVPTGRLLLITYLGFTTGTTEYAATITPAGGSAITISQAGVTDITVRTFNTLIVLGAGDAITVPRSLGVMGIMLTAPAGVTRVLQRVDSAASYTVPASSLFLLTAAFMADTGGVTNQLTIDGVTGVTVVSPQQIAATASWLTMLPFKAGQVIGGVDGDDIAINGLVYTAN